MAITILKRNGQEELYNEEKICAAIYAAFASISSKISDENMALIVSQIKANIDEIIKSGSVVSVENIQDIVEEALAKDYYREAKSFILYREDRAKKRLARRRIFESFESIWLSDVLKEIQNNYTDSEYSLDILYNKFLSFKKDNMSDIEKLSVLVKAAVELTTMEAPKWEFIASKLLFLQFSISLEKELKKRNILSFYDKLVFLEENGLYGSYILQKYSREEIEELGKYFDDSRNSLLTYSSLDLMLKRYVIKTRNHQPIETPQEMFMGISMHLAMNEDDKLSWSKKFYDIFSTLKVTMATPTMSNARKPYNQLSSCFIDTVPDTLDGIYRSIDNFAQISKFGGGMGMYFGKVRAVASPIRGFQGVAGGVIRWIKLANDTAVAVDQLGVRQGSVAVYLDAWHKDLPEFLQVRTNNGDDRLKAHDVFPAVCYPDLFWRSVRDDLDGIWYLMCPHEILSVKGYSLEDYYGDDWETRYKDCISDNRISKRQIPIKDLVRIILKSIIETGTPFTFNRDHVNKLNPNSHKGIIYCSNLCTEIAQNMSPIELISKEIVDIDGNTVVVQTTKPGDFVVCNLASLSLGNIDVDNLDVLNETIECAIRALDNVIDLNYYPITYAKITNTIYRSIGLGTSGYHHLLAKKGIVWESDEHLRYMDDLFEKINYAAIRASCNLAREKGKYKYFEGSEWQTGEYFEKRQYSSTEWQNLKNDVSKFGLRNAYIMSIAPTSSTSIIAGTTAGLDPIMKRYYLEEKKGSIVPRVAPNLNKETFWIYKDAHLIDQEWIIKAAGVRQRHIDQSQSLNLYITNKFTIKQVLNLYIKAWESNVKTIYYTRGQSLEVEECDVCTS